MPVRPRWNSEDWSYLRSKGCRLHGEKEWDTDLGLIPVLARPKAAGRYQPRVMSLMRTARHGRLRYVPVSYVARRCST